MASEACIVILIIIVVDDVVVYLVMFKSHFEYLIIIVIVMAIGMIASTLSVACSDCSSISNSLNHVDRFNY